MLIGRKDTDKAIHLAMITFAGLIGNAYSDDIQNKVTADDLFMEVTT